MRYKNIGTNFFRFVAIHAFDRRKVLENKMLSYRRETALQGAL